VVVAISWVLRGEQGLRGVVLGSPVQSSFLSIFDKTGTETGPHFLKFSKTETETVIDQSTVVSCGFLQLQDQFTTGPRPVLYMVVDKIITFLAKYAYKHPLYIVPTDDVACAP